MQFLPGLDLVALCLHPMAAKKLAFFSPPLFSPLPFLLLPPPPSVGSGCSAALPAPPMARSGDPTSSPGPADEGATPVDLLMAGTARAIPGRTKEEGARIVMDALRRASEAQLVLRPPGQEGEWLHRRFINTDLDIGLATWKHFKRTHSQHIELDGSQQWVRLRPSAAGD